VIVMNKTTMSMAVGAAVVLALGVTAAEAKPGQLSICHVPGPGHSEKDSKAEGDCSEGHKITVSMPGAVNGHGASAPEGGDEHPSASSYSASSSVGA